MPVCKAAMLAPCNPIQIEEEAWLWLTNEFVDLAADVAQIDVRAIGVAHVNRMAAAEIHADLWRAGAKDPGIRGKLDMRSDGEVEHGDVFEAAKNVRSGI